MDARRAGALLFVSGAAALLAETVFLRRLATWVGGTATASTLTVAAYLGGLALGALAARRLPSGPRTYAALELAAAGWVATFPALLAAVAPAGRSLPAAIALAALLVVPPAAAAGATWPALLRGRSGEESAGTYAANTAGAVLGTLLATFVTIPLLGVRGTELLAAALGVGAAAGAWTLPGGAEPAAPAAPPGMPLGEALAWAAIAAFACTGLEIWWLRLAAIGLGATVQALGLVLATFLATLAAGAALGRTWPADPRRAAGLGLAGLGTLALLGGTTWAALPHVVAGAYGLLGPDLWWGSAGVVLAMAMGGAPAASGLAFAGLVRSRPADADALLAANGAGSVLGALAAGLWLVPALEARGTLWILAGLAAVAGAACARSGTLALPALALALAQPAWDARLYAVGLHLRLSEFADRSPRAVRRFADEGWDLLLYDQGATAAVAVGRSRRTGNVWLSLDGKVDASTGDDMPTQVLSGEIPTLLSPHPREVLVVGLASGVTAGAVLRDARVERLTILELEPAVLRAEPFFRHVNGDPLADPRVELVVDDARAWLARTDRRFDVIVSEPSNPWITGVSGLFTDAYWGSVRDHLAEGGVAAQWIQLYGLGGDELRGLLRTWRTAFPDTTAYETIEDADLLLVAGGTGAPTPIPAVLGPVELAEVAGEGWINTDDRPRIEWRAPLFLHTDTAAANGALLRAGRAR